MTTTVNALLGTLFLLLSTVTTVLMFQYWGYPYDKQRRCSECPQWKMNIHRSFGYAYVVVYLVLMTQMVPRLWTYQVEFPPRTVAHLMLGITIGVILVVKLSILRFWRHFEGWMPVLGTLLFLCTVLLTGLSLPFVYQERAMVSRAPGGGAFSALNRERLTRLLPTAGMPESVDLESLASSESLRAGRGVLLEKCVTCHDLRTVIAKPRTPSNWYRTAVRMAEKPTLVEPLEEHELNQVTAFLVAITPELQQSLKAKRAIEQEQEQLLEVAREAPTTPTGGEQPALSAGAKQFDMAEARATFEAVCSQCHETSDVEFEPPESVQEVASLVERMIGNGLEAEPEELSAVKWYLEQTYAKGE